MLQLRAGDSSVVLVPKSGGAMLGWQAGTMAVLRRPDPDALLRGDVRGFGCFPLLPFANRIGGARFTWRGRDYALARNFGDSPHAIHGLGWQSAWAVTHVAPNAATLALHHDATGTSARNWPFAFEAVQEFTLDRDGLAVTLRLINRCATQAPAGLGWHPYFPRDPAPTLRFRADGVWRNDAAMLPVTHGPVPAEWDHTEGRPAGAAVLDNCFTGWDGVATIDGPGFSLGIQADATLRHLQVYTPPGERFFCVEPVSHMPDALNRPDQSMHVLAPGETLTAGVRFRLTR